MDLIPRRAEPGVHGFGKISFNQSFIEGLLKIIPGPNRKGSISENFGIRLDSETQLSFHSLRCAGVCANWFRVAGYTSRPYFYITVDINWCFWCLYTDEFEWRSSKIGKYSN